MAWMNAEGMHVHTACKLQVPVCSAYSEKCNQFSLKCRNHTQSRVQKLGTKDQNPQIKTAMVLMIHQVARDVSVMHKF